MSKRSDADFAAKVGNEGLDYAILHYFGRAHKEIPAAIKADWATAYDALQRIEKWLGEFEED